MFDKLFQSFYFNSSRTDVVVVVVEIPPLTSYYTKVIFPKNTKNNTRREKSHFSKKRSNFLKKDQIFRPFFNFFKKRIFITQNYDLSTMQRCPHATIERIYEYFLDENKQICFLKHANVLSVFEQNVDLCVMLVLLLLLL